MFGQTAIRWSDTLEDREARLYKAQDVCAFVECGLRRGMDEDKKSLKFTVMSFGQTTASNRS